MTALMLTMRVWRYRWNGELITKKVFELPFSFLEIKYPYEPDKNKVNTYCPTKKFRSYKNKNT